MSELDDQLVTVVVQLTEYFSDLGALAVTVRRVWEDGLEPLEGAADALVLEVVREDVEPPWRFRLPGAIPLTLDALEAALDNERLVESWEWDLLEAWWHADLRRRGQR